MDEEDGTQLPDPAERLDELMARVRMKEYKKRATASVPFDMGQNMKMSISIYSLNRPQAKGLFSCSDTVNYRVYTFFLLIWSKPHLFKKAN